MGRVPHCHPERPHEAHGLCRQCYKQTDAQKATARLYQEAHKDEYRAYCLAHADVIKAGASRWRKDPKNKATLDRSYRKYRQSDKRKVVSKRYKQSAKGRAALTRENASDAGRTRIRRYRRTEKGAALVRKMVKKSRYKNLYGITVEHHQQLVEKLNGLCPICRRPPGKNGFAVDHCHRLKKFRGVICPNCNVGLGMFADSPEHLRSAALYLEQFNREAHHGGI